MGVVKKQKLSFGKDIEQREPFYTADENVLKKLKTDNDQHVQSQSWVREVSGSILQLAGVTMFNVIALHISNLAREDYECSPHRETINP